ncbi:MAG: branched-chain amino acid ABC transporter permease [Egibacteraceae bacterium]
MRGRPRLYTSYERDMALLNTPGKRAGVVGIVGLAAALPFVLTDDLLVVGSLGLVASIGAIGLNLVTGYAGQVSLGHAFFIGLGAYTAAVIGSDPERARALTLGVTFLPVWLLAAGVVAGIAGLLVAPLAVRLRGLYLAMVTLGLVFLGEHVFKEVTLITGGVGVGRVAAKLDLFGFDFSQDSSLLTSEQQTYLLMLALLVLFALIGRNIARSDVGRAFAAVRDRDLAAQVIGVNLARQKAAAFTVSSFYAGVTGALFYTISGFLEPTEFGLRLSVQYIAMILIGGTATISGSIMGALFISTLGRLAREALSALPFAGGLGGGGALNVFQLETIVYGLLIIGFLRFEPRGLYGIWVRIRNYWKGWPFSY